MRFTGYSFGSIQVDGVTYDHDLIIDRGKIRKRKKAGSRKFRDAYGHTPLSVAEDIPWRCRRLVVGTGAGGAAGDAAGPGRGPAPQGRPCRPAHGLGDRRADQGTCGHQRNLAPDLLKLPWFRYRVPAKGCGFPCEPLLDAVHVGRDELRPGAVPQHQ